MPPLTNAASFHAWVPRPIATATTRREKKRETPGVFILYKIALGVEIEPSEYSLLFYDALPQRSISNHGRLASTHLPREDLRGVASQVLLSRTGDLPERFIFLSERGLGNKNGLALQDATQEAASG